jgi:ribosome-binding protein aMBF1 (putative translation factor)
MTGYGCKLCGKGSNGEEFFRYVSSKNGIEKTIYVCRQCATDGSQEIKIEIYIPNKSLAFPAASQLSN